MAFQIVELAIDEGDSVIERKVVPYPFATRAEAAAQIESVITKYSSSGYQPQHDYWWVRAQNGDKLRFVIEIV
jgi:hypothetical protein